MLTIVNLKLKNSDSIHFIDKQTVNLIKVNFFEHPNKYQYFDFFYEKNSGLIQYKNFLIYLFYLSKIKLKD